MTYLRTFLRNEPAMSAAIISAVIALAAALGLKWTATEVGGALAVITLVLGLVVRQRVTPLPPAPPPAHEKADASGK